MIETDQVENLKDFSFFVPVDLEKAKNDEWRIKGIASTDHMDLQGEIIRQDSLDITPLTDGRGLFNWDHKPGPENLIGKIDNASIGKDGLFVEGYLFKNTDRAKGIYNILTSLKSEDKRRVGFSIEGKVLKRCGVNGREIIGARVEKVAVTVDPVNPNTYAELVKSLTAENNVLKQDSYTKDQVMNIVNDSVQKALDLSKQAKNFSASLNLGSYKKSREEEVNKINTLKPILRKAKVLVKYFNRDHIPVLMNADGSPTAYAKIAKSWGESIPLNASQAKELGKRSLLTLNNCEKILKSYASIKSVGYRVVDFIIRVYNDDSNYLYLAELGQALKVSLEADNEEQVRVNLEKIQNFFETVAIHLIYDNVMSIYDEIDECLKVKKALQAGNYNQAPSQLTGGASMQSESLESKKKKKKEDSKKD